MKNKKIFFIIGLVTLSVSCCFILFYVLYPIKYQSQIKKHCDEYGLDYSLVAAVICVESRFDKNAVSSSGASGLMQLMPSTYLWVKSSLSSLSDDIFDVDANIEAGCFYLNYLLSKYKKIEYVLACYNAGEGVVAKWCSPDTFDISKVQYPETRQYINKVLKLENLYACRFD